MEINDCLGNYSSTVYESAGNKLMFSMSKNSMEEPENA